MRVQLQSRLDIRVSEQCLYRLGVSFAPNQERSEAMPQIVEAEPSRVIFHHLTIFILVRRKDTHFGRAGRR